MEVDDVTTTRGLMESVYILSDHASYASSQFQIGDCRVCGIRFRLSDPWPAKNRASPVPAPL